MSPSSIPPSIRGNVRSQGVAARFRANLLRSRVVLYSTLLPLLTLAAFSLEAPRRLAGVVLGFSLIIFVHELGHFLVARWCQVKTEVFSIGIGPRMLGWKKGVGFSFGREPDMSAKVGGELAAAAAAGDVQQTATEPTRAGREVGECDYRLSWLPLGGYVRMLGQDDLDPTKVSDDPRSFNNRPIWQRMCIVSAGVIMNVIFAIVVFAVLFSPNVGVNFPPAIVGGAQVGTPADSASLVGVEDGKELPTKGLQVGDEVVEIDGKKPSEGFMEFTDIMIASALTNQGDTVKLTIKRDGKLYVTNPPLEPKRNDSAGGFQLIGVEPQRSLKVANFNVELSADEKADIAERQPAVLELQKHKGAAITAVDGSQVESYTDLYRKMQAAEGKDVKLTLKAEDGTFDLTVHTYLERRLGAEGRNGLVGLHPRPKVMNVLPDSAAAAAGIRRNDLIVRVGVTADPSEAEFLATVEGSAGQPLALTVLRDGKPVDLSATPRKVKDKGQLGVLFGPDFDHPVVAKTDAGANGAFAAVTRGATIVSVNGEKVGNWGDIRRLLLENAGKKVEVQFTDATGKELPDVTLMVGEAEQRSLATCQYSANLPLENLQRVQKASSHLGAVQMGMEHTYKFIVQTYLTLRGLFTGRVPVSGLHGPLGIGKIGYEAQEQGYAHLFFILAVVSVNLAVANFLPLPIVDGGLFILLIIEKLRGRPLPLKILNVINIAGLCLLGFVFLFVTFNNDLGLFWKH